MQKENRFYGFDVNRNRKINPQDCHIYRLNIGIQGTPPAGACIINHRIANYFTLLKSDLT